MQSGGSFRLIVRRGPQPNQVYELIKDISTLGRDITNDITINDPEVSRHHCRFTRGGGGYTIEDLGSTNGTFVNGQRLTGARPLSSGDIVGLGETVILAYEATSMAPAGGGYAEPPAQATMVGPSAAPAQAGGYYDPYAAQAPGYAAAPPAPPPAYNYQDEPMQGGGAGRWLFLACGCFLVLCIISSVIGIIVVDATCAWDDIPVLSNVVDALGFQVDSSSCS
ncbi:MAG: FHA domain-containing protein [Chloroflexi bacterium]|nr:FHA domain-containing protein [Chloroflexota bacterium]